MTATAWMTSSGPSRSAWRRSMVQLPITDTTLVLGRGRHRPRLTELAMMPTVHPVA
jgi:hypothetical protein